MFKISTYLSENPILTTALIAFLILEFYSHFTFYQKFIKIEMKGLSWIFSLGSRCLTSKQIDLIRILINSLVVICLYLTLANSLSFPRLNDLSPYLRFALFVTLVSKLINYLFDIFFNPGGESDSHKNQRSKTFGIIERLAIGFLLLFKAFETIGLILAAKALVRENKIKGDDDFAEFYFIGTLFSLIGVLGAWAICFW